ncbi:MAG: hypothetical protein IKT83_06655 [Bacteroidaceae bacterium]|nr:hypothetical protein [Bacteroidaceae bacterium]
MHNKGTPTMKMRVHIQQARLGMTKPTRLKLSIGGELELSNNFVEKGFKAMPALGAKWTF